ncbi:hypothetical protein BCR37DRAFT_384263 [Protomyces lactucae-debilis]|uniref:DHHA2 domain-containing protein n=1 Tax=Protomyces lactucae-debilis TaxID=2754530 RepID=A0A1Y2ETF1_PROLT|nr:uncharacterized protein BCR37DRAFT_384263 [Protomyces lactucae-debilis]ORY74841.1 hypothetical protein BCR37DRAFT_384263 [Protomyces lactucae-debilis]
MTLSAEMRLALLLQRTGCMIALPWSQLTGSILDHNHFKVEGIDASEIKVLGVVDHHVDEHLYLDAKPRIVQQCGSCCSLVVQYFQSSWAEQGFDGEAELIPLLLSAILTDTANLTQQMTDIDVDMVKFLRSRIMASAVTGTWNEAAMLRALRDAKRDNAGLTTAEMFRRDYKEWDLGDAGKWGVSSVTTSMDDLAKEADWLQTSSRHAKARSLDIHLVMTKHGPKELMCHVANPAKSSWMDKFLKLATPELQLESWAKEPHSGPEFYTFQQLNTVYTRKKVAILCQEMLRTG